MCLCEQLRSPSHDSPTPSTSSKHRTLPTRPRRRPTKELPTHTSHVHAITYIVYILHKHVHRPLELLWWMQIAVALNTLTLKIAIAWPEPFVLTCNYSVSPRCTCTYVGDVHCSGFRCACGLSAIRTFTPPLNAYLVVPSCFCPRPPSGPLQTPLDPILVYNIFSLGLRPL